MRDLLTHNVPNTLVKGIPHWHGDTDNNQSESETSLNESALVLTG